MNRGSVRLLPAITFLLFAVFSHSFGQEPRLTREKEIRALIQASLSKDYKAADDANSKLSKLSPADMDVLTRIVRQGQTCERTKASQIVVDRDRNNRDLIPILVELSKGGNESSTEEELLCRRGATFLLAFSTEGIHVLTGLLKDGENLFIRRSAIFAFDELTETGNYPEGSLEAMKDAIPVIAESGKLDDDVMRNMSDEVLRQIARQGNKDLSPLAKRYISPD